MAIIDRRTDRPIGDHGTAAQAIDFALDLDGEIEPFLRAWREGYAFSEWPEFYSRLEKDRA